MGYKGMRNSGGLTEIDFGSRKVTLDGPATLTAITGAKTVAKLEAAINTFLDANKEDGGEVWRVHIYSLSPLRYAVVRFQHGGKDWVVPTNWWPT